MRRDVLIRALATSVAVDPTNRAIRQIYAEFLLEAGRGEEAREQCAVLLAQRADDPEVLQLEREAEALCERSVQAVIEAIPDSIDDLIAMWDGSADTSADTDTAGDDAAIDLTVRAQPTAHLPLAPLGRLSRPERTLDALGGVDGIKDALRAFGNAADDPSLISLAGVSGFTLYGAPGSGKRTLVEAFAAELRAECLTIPVDDLLTASLDGRAVDMRSIIDFAARRGRCVVHLEDLEELWAGSVSHLAVERAHLCEQIAALLDRRIHSAPDLIVLATSSRPWKLPAMLVTPERLGRSLFVPPPDLYARAQMIWAALGSERRDEVDVWEVARHTDGFSGDDLARICRTALDRSAGTYRSGLTSRVTTRSVLDVASTAEASIDRWVGHARLAMATLIPSIDLSALSRWLRSQTD